MSGRESENKYRVFSPSREFMHPALFIIPVGGYSWVYSSKIDGMVAILCIFIQWNLRHLLHVLAGMFTQREKENTLLQSSWFPTQLPTAATTMSSHCLSGHVFVYLQSCVAYCAQLCWPQTWPLMLQHSWTDFTVIDIVTEVVVASTC